MIAKCAFCNDTACYDGDTTIGLWAYMCERHFKQYGVGLGSDKGQKLVSDKPRYRLRKTEKNLFVIAGRVSATLQKAGQHEKAKELADRLFQCNSYDEAIALMQEYVEIY